MSEEKPTFKDELENIINALFALMPTANRISQFVLLADGQDFEVMREAYPELLGDKRTRINSSEFLVIRSKTEKYEKRTHLTMMCLAFSRRC